MSGRLGRYKDLAWFVAKYSRADFVTRALNGTDKTSSSDPSAAEAFAQDLESLGPTFIKLGQVLSTRADLLPAAYLEALARLQDDVEPFSYEDVERTIGKSSGSGCRMPSSSSIGSRSPQHRSARCITRCCAAAARSP
jgi:predicted unusual protein kinase regulating ubiquinone biosynthesis (AarF/ABC1/UbiB family)